MNINGVVIFKDTNENNLTRKINHFINSNNSTINVLNVQISQSQYGKHESNMVQITALVTYKHIPT